MAVSIPVFNRESSFRQFVTKNELRDNFHAQDAFLTPAETLLVSETIQLVHKKITDKVPKYDRNEFRKSHGQQNELKRDQLQKELRGAYTQLMHDYGLDKLTSEVKESMLEEAKREERITTPRKE